ncbi:unnamed protein product [Leuciscus chuanchicus]
MKECVIVFSRILRRGRPVNILIGHSEVENGHAQGIYAITKKAFAELWDQCGDWLEKTVALGADGAAVNLVSKGGVIALLQKDAGDFIIPFHCMPHRLELAMLSVLKDNAMIRQVYDMLHLVWKTYHFSPKSMRELKTIVEDLGVDVLVPGGVKGTRWLPHVSRALETFLRPRQNVHQGQFTAVHCHMDHLAGSSANADVAGRATKVNKSIEDGTFVAIRHFLADVFARITKFSLLLQKNETIQPQAVCALGNLLVTTEVKAARPKPGGRLSQFLADLRLQKRQQDEQGHGEDDVKSATIKAVKCFSILNYDSWLEDQEELVDHGADDHAFLLDHFSPVLTSWPRGPRKYVSPPVSLLAQTLCKVREDEEQVLLVAPYWPTRTWFPELMLLVIVPSWPIPLRKDLLTPDFCTHVRTSGNSMCGPWTCERLEVEPVHRVVFFSPRGPPKMFDRVRAFLLRDQVVNLQALPLEEADPALTLLCPVHTLQLYVDRTQSLRTSDQLFVYYGGQQKGKAVSKQRMANWIVDAIALAYQAQGVPCPLRLPAHSLLTDIFRVLQR